MAVLDWLQQLLGGGDPEASGAAAASTAMQPATQPFVNLGRDLTNTLAVQPVTDAFGVFDRVLSGQGFTPEEALGVAALPVGGSAFGGRGGLGSGIRAYHGSPHDFDRFDLSKIGTGEGAQAYGHGLYFAESEPVALQYRNAVKDNATITALNNQMSGVAREIEKLGQLPNREWADPRWPEYDRLKAEYDRLMQQREAAVSAPGHMYEVDINADPKTFLDWDKRIAEQPNPAARELAVRHGIDERLLGSGAYQQLAADLGGIRTRTTPVGSYDLPYSDPAKTSAALREAGIPGVRYLDQGSRGAGQGSHNYAVFNDNLIQILRKYGILPPLAAGGLLAAQPGSE